MARFGKVLVANRGEIAVRVLRSARAAGYRTVAVYSDADADAPHVAQADEAIRIGPPEVAASYLSTEAILAAAARSGADAVHPGYGFLSENAAFAEACEAAGLTFIGPDPAAIRAMGDKAEAKRRMIAAGVPCIPGYEGEDQSDARLVRAAREIGFPVMIKASAGGGGRGMRLVAGPGGFEQALRAARSEALNGFGDGTLIVEKALPRPRHVEVQVFGDAHGNVIHLGERDCSVQRRHQKVIEEAPSPAVTPAIRAAMGEAAVKAAKSIAYRGAGTVEFLLDGDGAFYFMEMNTRLQVEHPVTEAITGLDLVDWQCRIAAGEELPLTQEEVVLDGHAIEARLYAEDPARDFLPGTGRVALWSPPEGPGIRVDHGLARDLEVSSWYDPMLAKIVARGRDRDEARRRLVRALGDCAILGLTTNRGFLLDCLEHDVFVAGEATTAFVGTDWTAPDPAAGAAPPGPAALALAALLFRNRGADSDGFAGFGSTGPRALPCRLRAGETEHAFTMTVARDGVAVATIGEQTLSIRILENADGQLRFDADGHRRRAAYAFAGKTLLLACDGREFSIENRLLAPPRKHDSAADGRILAPMTGRVVAVRAAADDRVGRGQCLLVIEAMKMEHEIVAPAAGRIAAIHVADGDQVAARKLLVEIASEPAGTAEGDR
ncbi:acetyl/propionyl/methylcrotonyl-CoA carboxylase subunit alpha [Oceanibacterium hippocampi]|uniref:Acetyl-/propionyl-coenzyme A carboxylase alpha chain n=1 Tax=Oceanibacterium hippocampi TaxID=745714 RepID=A0A1Y5S160_9PROT|nr:acetyl-CoA carboxylase biotin carboxylase subunit [Oceanibacterium hippocampi]SLN29281.1 Acetyl-/propionyl-coenzyme A carboxylase alpha chain [Oceanibacterium hippocampi]